MIIGFSGASGRTDASHCALLVARTVLAGAGRAALVVAGPGAVVADGSVPTIRIHDDVPEPAAALRSAVTEARTVVADLPRRWLERADVRSVLDVAVVVVGPHRLDELAAGATASTMDGMPAPWYLAWRRGGGTPAAARFAAAMAALAPGARTLPVAVPPLGRAEAAALERSAPTGRAYRAGLDLLAAIREAAGEPGTGDPENAAAFVAASLADRLRDLADDVEAAEAGLPPDPARLADAPILDAWSIAAIPVPVVKGSVTGHPGIADGRRARTTEVYLTDRATYARTLSRWYRLRAPAGAPAPGLQ